MLSRMSSLVQTLRDQPDQLPQVDSWRLLSKTRHADFDPFMRRLLPGGAIPPSSSPDGQTRWLLLEDQVVGAQPVLPSISGPPGADCRSPSVSLSLSLSFSLCVCVRACSGLFAVRQQDIERLLESNRKAVEETIQKRFAFHQEIVTLSELSAAHFQRIRQHVRMTVEPVDWSAILPSLPPSSSPAAASIPAFQWGDENEKQQYDRCLQYLTIHLSLPPRLSVDRAPLNLLDTFKSPYLPFDLRGSSDVMVVNTASGNLPVFGIRMLFELRKKRPEAKDGYEAMGELLAADQHTPNTPIVVLTDLAEYWMFCWLEGRQLRFCEAPSRDAAFRAIQAALNVGDQQQSAAAQAPVSKRRKLSDSILQDEERARQRRRSDEAAEMEEENELSDDDDEDRSSRRRRAIRDMILNTPAFIRYLRPEIATAYQPAPPYHTAAAQCTSDHPPADIQ